MVGKNFFEDYTQKFIHHNEILNNLTHRLLAGNSGFGVYDYGTGQRLNTAYPIFVNGKPTYFIQVVTPTVLIYSQVNDILLMQRIETFALFAGTTSAISVLIIFLIKWSSTLDNEVKRRTKELGESNKQLELTNEQLKVHDKMQKEFINIASHEMKTPTQAILGYSALLQQHPEKREDMIQAISRNATRLQRLTNDILDVTKIESQSLKLNKELFNLNDLISNIVDDFRNDIEKQNNNNNNIKLSHEYSFDLLVEADKGRIAQVISNLVSNAIRFSKENGGNNTISVATKNIEEGKQVIVSVTDTGTGIDPQILQRLFTKFTTKSQTGIGLGLFISKNIIEAHGGKIWAENNKYSKGATFYFSLSLIK